MDLNAILRVHLWTHCVRRGSLALGEGEIWGQTPRQIANCCCHLNQSINQSINRGCLSSRATSRL